MQLKMPKQEIIDWIRTEKQRTNLPLRIPSEIFDLLDLETARKIADEFGSNTLILLPDYEIAFFEWLKKESPEIWEDLWGGVAEEPYVVSISLLTMLIDKFRGFPICDLINNDNYYFTDELIVWEIAYQILDGIRERFLNREELTLAERLLLEISIHPIDIWHFAYHYRLKIDELKTAINELVEDNLLIHLKKANDLAQYVHF